MKRINLDITTIAKVKAILRRHPNYGSFSRTRASAFEFVSLVGTRVCPYCNINYTYTVTAGKKSFILRCDIDHFEAQAHAPSNALQYDNLIPSCQQCNSRLKLAKKFSITTHLHPYRDSFDEIKVFQLDIHSPNYLNDEGFKIVIVKRPSACPGDDTRGTANIRDFRLEERYARHKPEAVDILRKIKFYHALRRKEIVRLTRLVGSLDVILFGSDWRDINSVSLGKLKKDLIETYR